MEVVEYGRIHNGKQRVRCHSCHRQFTPEASKMVISSETKQLIDRLLFEHLPLAGVARLPQVSESWLKAYANHEVVCTAELIEVPLAKKPG